MTERLAYFSFYSPGQSESEVRVIKPPWVKAKRMLEIKQITVTLDSLRACESLVELWHTAHLGFYD